MKKLVKLLVENRSFLPECAAQLHSVFGDAIAIQPYGVDDFDSAADSAQKEDAFLVAATSASNFSELRRTRLRGRDLIPIGLCPQRRPLLELNGYPKGTRALLVNVSKLMPRRPSPSSIRRAAGTSALSPGIPAAGGRSSPWR